MKRTLSVKLIATVFTISILWLGYICFGFWTAMIFTSGFLGGLILWLIFPQQVPFTSIRVPYWITLIAFLIHRVEEKIMNFFASLSKITGVPTPEITSIPVLLLVLTSVGAWLCIPYLVKRNFALGYYLAWTFFAAMGITELAHFIFPLFTNEPYGYFPGMATVLLLAPLAWWGLCRLYRYRAV